MYRGTPTGRHCASGSSLPMFSTRSLNNCRDQGRNGTSTCWSALLTPFHFGSAMLPAKPGYQAPLPPKSGRPSGRCGAGPATGCFPGEAGWSLNWPGVRNGPGSLARGCCATTGTASRATQQSAARIRLPVAGAELMGVRVPALLLQLPRAFERVEHHVIALMAGIFVDRIAVIELVRIVDLPGLGPRAGIADGGVVAQLVGSHA